LCQLSGDVPALLDGWTLVVHFSSRVALVIVGSMSSAPSIAPVSDTPPPHGRGEHSPPHVRRNAVVTLTHDHRNGQGTARSWFCPMSPSPDLTPS
jgi:hypothetical protein